MRRVVHVEGTFNKFELIKMLKEGNMDDNLLVEPWRKVDLSKPPYVFPGDEKYINDADFFSDINSDVEYVKRLGEVRENPCKGHLGLIPIPYLGNLKTAKIFILMANPGLGAADYKGEFEDAGFRQAMINNLRQEKFDEYPFVSLNPQFSWHGGFEYWEGKFTSIINRLVENGNATYDQALKLLSNNIACLELISYHSKSNLGITNLESTISIKDYVHQDLKPRAQKGEIEIIVTRKTAGWGLECDTHITVYPTNQARTASLSIGSNGGKRIFDVLDKKYTKSKT
jgi:hypothetical protein